MGWAAEDSTSFDFSRYTDNAEVALAARGVVKKTLQMEAHLERCARRCGQKRFILFSFHVDEQTSGSAELSRQEQINAAAFSLLKIRRAGSRVMSEDSGRMRYNEESGIYRCYYNLWASTEAAA